ncbi:sodium:solute symporter family protein [Sphingosinicella microcystinivorans]|uniref:sodium:solute symporter family protein n=1 Tax=Sphingosinicella microcystinivorans TaxID=335406 RepID=UPI0022F37E73|nr:sodium:solute symporter family protein [Sphingosinicella microcystinivorans]WBX84164.1 sodium:solute symporter family protein [Sphingosinicella microcystinivorans]
MTIGIAFAIVLCTVVGSIVYGRRMQRARTVTEWAVGGRRFGTLIFWFLNAGEIYTTFAVLGISGFAWAYGAPAYLAFTSVSLAATLGYLLIPRIWNAGRSGGHITQADFFAARYRAPWLGVLVGSAGIMALVVYVQIQITALGLIVRMTFGAEISILQAAVIAAIVMLLFVYFAGLRSAAFAAGVKDVLMLVIVIALSVTVASEVGATSMLDVYRKAQEAYPGIGSFPGLQPDANLTTTWFVTSALNVALGTWVFPHMFQLCYAAADTTTIRRNTIFQPLYSLSYFFIILLGLGALLAATAPPNGDINAVLLQFVSDRQPAWLVGVFAGTACLLALVPGSILLLTAGSIFSRNVIAPIWSGMGETSSLLVSRGSMIVFAAAAVWLTIGASSSLVEIGLRAYAAIGMLAPGVYFAFLWPRANAYGILAGIVAGYIVLLQSEVGAMFTALLPGFDKGLIAMAVNAIIAAVVVVLTTSRCRERKQLPA